MNLPKDQIHNALKFVLLTRGKKISFIWIAVFFKFLNCLDHPIEMHCSYTVRASPPISVNKIAIRFSSDFSFKSLAVS